MSNGLKIAIGILCFGCLIPLVTMFVTLRNKPVYHTSQPSFENQDCFVQFTWQEKPVVNLEHILVFLKKPDDYVSGSGLDMFPPVKTEGYYVLPRAVFYKNKNILSSLQKVFRMGKKDVRVFIVIQGKAFPVHLSPKALLDLQKLVVEVEDHKKVSAKLLGERMAVLQAWKEIKADLDVKREMLSKGELDLEPHRERSDFMR